MVLAPMSSVMKGAIQSLSPMVAFLLDCVEPLVPRSFQRVFSGCLFGASFAGASPLCLPYHRHLC